MNRLCRLAFPSVLFVAQSLASAQPVELRVGVDAPGPRISPLLYGLMTEEINHSYDGGLYAELIQNRTFRDAPFPPPPPRRAQGAPPPPPAPLTTQPAAVPEQPAHWSLVTGGGGEGSMIVDTADPVNTTALTHSLRLDVTSLVASGRAGVANDGYWGIPVKPNTTYRASFYARAGSGFNGPINLSIESADGTRVAATASVAGVTAEWKRYEATLTTGDVPASTDNRFVLSTTLPGTVWFNLVSLMPPTFHDRPNGLRPDLMELLADMKPGFLRFPGGNYLEGDYFNERFAWKETIGPIEQRPGHNGPWRYRSSDGLGLLEFLEWCEDLKCEPVLAVFAGYTLRGQSIAGGPDLQPYVDEALEEIEYVTGGPETTWGARRVKDGHPEPFKLTYVEVGNEDFFDARDGKDTYDGRFAQFFDAIRAKYPKLQVIATTKVKSRTPDVIDDHFYRTAAAMQRDVRHYDRTDRTGPKIFVGEWASREGGGARTLTPNVQASLGDAAWMTGLERNADHVIMSCYAPLLTNVNRGASQWQTDLIGYDAGGSFGSPSYYIQAMFGQNRGDVVLPVTLGGAAEATTRPTTTPVETLFATASRDDASGDVIVKFVNVRGTPQQVHMTLAGVTNVTSAQGWTVAGEPMDVNSVAEPKKVATRPLAVTAKGPDFMQTFPAYSASVVRVRTR